MPRKTFNIELLTKQVNEMLATSTCEPAGRQGMIVVLEDLLHKSGNYRGYTFLHTSDIPKGQKPGIRTGGREIDQLPYETRFEDTDKTRVKYY